MRVPTLLALFAFSAGAHAQLYTCVELGKKVIRQTPCENTAPRKPEAPQPLQRSMALEKAVTAVTPIYSQLVMFSYPPGFKPAFAKDSGPQYIQEYVLEGETIEKWSQMVTVTGAKGLAANQEVTPQRFLQQIAGGFQRACPSTFAAQALGTLKISGHDAFAALVGCGTVSSGGPRCEVAVLLAVKGSADYYTIQWAERAQQSSQPPVLDSAKWLARLKQLNPIKLCAHIPSEPAPYPSCINQK